MSDSPPEPPFASALAQWFAPRRFALMLATALGLVFWKILFAGESLFYRDYSLLGYPFAWFQRECFWRGELPFWNPLINCGAPFLAQWNTLALYPGTLIYLLLPMPWSLGFFCVAHLFLGGMGMYFLARCWTGNSLASAVAGLAFVFNGVTISSHIYPNYLVALGWMPWVLLATQRAWRDGGRRLVPAALAGAMQMLSGAPEIILLTWLLAAALMLFETTDDNETSGGSQFATASKAAEKLETDSLSPSEGERARVRGERQHLSLDGRDEPRAPSPQPSPPSDGGEGVPQTGWQPRPLKTARNQIGAAIGTRIRRFAAVVALVTGLTAVQMLPFFDLLAQSQRGSASFGGQFWAMPGWGWANLLAPLFHCGQTIQGLFVQSGQSFYPSYYPGAAVLGLALLAVLGSRDRRVWLLAAATILAVLLAMGGNGPLFPLLQNIIPGLGIARYPIKLVTLAAFTLPLLAASGVQRWLEPSDDGAARRKLWLVWGLLFAALASIALFGWKFPFATDNVRVFLENVFARALLLALAGVALFSLKRAVRPREFLIASGALAALIVIDLCAHRPKQIPTFSGEAFTPRLLQTSRRIAAPPVPGAGRVMVSPYAETFFNTRLLPDFFKDFIGARLAQWYALNLLDGVPKVNGPSTLQAREELAVESLFYGRTNANLPRLMDFLGVTHATSPGGLMDWQPRPSALPIITVGQKPVFATAAESLRALESDALAPTENVFLPMEARPFVKAAKRMTARIHSRTFSNARVEAEVEAAEPTLLVVAQTHSPSWRATVDGQPARLWKANHAFQCVEVPAGRHRVTLVYRERRFGWGSLISGATAVICVWLWRRKVISPVPRPL
ncbi:MAG: YfhO family protein [Verrucomicrobia bacterium]|nr:YfhO family protein [Verrucomicrobiota bacterium]